MQGGAGLVLVPKGTLARLDAALSPDEERLWARVVETVRPYGDSPRNAA
jgi:hypothetical protein